MTHYYIDIEKIVRNCDTFLELLAEIRNKTIFHLIWKSYLNVKILKLLKSKFVFIFFPKFLKEAKISSKKIFFTTRQQVQSPNKSTELIKKLSLPKLDCHRKARLSNVYCPSLFFENKVCYCVYSIPFWTIFEAICGNFGQWRKFIWSSVELAKLFAWQNVITYCWYCRP